MRALKSLTMAKVHVEESRNTSAAYHNDAQHIDPSTWVTGLLGRGRKFVLLSAVQIVGDAVVVGASAVLAYLMYASWPPSLGQVAWNLFTLPAWLLNVVVTPEFAPFQPVFIGAPLAYVVVMRVMGLYENTPTDFRPFAPLPIILRGVLFTTVPLALLFFATYRVETGGLVLLYFVYLGLLIFFGVALFHSATLIGVVCLQALGIGRIRVATIARPDNADEFAGTLGQEGSAYDFVGNIVPEVHSGISSGAKRLGVVADLTKVINDNDLDEVILAADPGDLSVEQRLAVAQSCWNLGTTLKMVTPFHPYFHTSAKPEVVGKLALLQVEKAGLYATWPQIAKRLMDIGLSLFGIIASAPVMAVTAMVIKLDSPGPIIFKQERVGLNGRTFKVWKFRSMRHDADPKLHQEFLEKIITKGQDDLKGKTGTVSKIPNDPRITRFGRFIRRTSIDELPQFFNVLRGEMSMVGPRPELPYAVELYDEWQSKRLNIRPGITGLWQVSGRSQLTYDEMFQLDITYVENWSLWLDAVIILKTIPVLLDMSKTT